VARPSKLTPKLEAELLQALRLGNTRTAACKYVQIPLQRLDVWMRRSDQLRVSVEQAEAAAELRVVGHLVQLVDAGDIQAIKFWLERRRPEHWGRQEHVKVDIEQTIRILAAEMGLDAEQAIAEAQRALTYNTHVARLA
jgi:hypothetical protein